MSPQPPPPTISHALQSALLPIIGAPFTASPILTPGSSSACDVFLLTPSSSSAGGGGGTGADPFADPAEPTHVLKVPRTPGGRRETERERAALLALHQHLSSRPSQPTAPAIPLPTPTPSPLPLGALLLPFLPGTPAHLALSSSSPTPSPAERLSILRAVGAAAHWVHSSLPADLLPPRGVELPEDVKADVRSPSGEEDALALGERAGAREWLRRFLRAQAARLAPSFSALVSPPLPGEEGSEAILDGPDLIAKEDEQERAVQAVTTLERALASPLLFSGPRDTLVCTHGDFSLPNVLLSRPTTPAGEWRAVGIVDWGSAGAADRRVDLRQGCWSVLYNAGLAGSDIRSVGESYVRAFLEGYVQQGGEGGGEEEVQWVMQDWEEWVRLKREGGEEGAREGCWEAWGEVGVLGELAGGV